ncbi:hypothetical protein ACHAWF_016986 [Thalassiosira exigua]
MPHRKDGAVANHLALATVAQRGHRQYNTYLAVATTCDNDGDGDDDDGTAPEDPSRTLAPRSALALASSLGPRGGRSGLKWKWDSVWTSGRCSVRTTPAQSSTSRERGPTSHSSRPKTRRRVRAARPPPIYLFPFGCPSQATASMTPSAGSASDQAPLALAGCSSSLPYAAPPLLNSAAAMQDDGSNVAGCDDSSRLLSRLPRDGETTNGRAVTADDAPGDGYGAIDPWRARPRVPVARPPRNSLWGDLILVTTREQAREFPIGASYETTRIFDVDTHLFILGRLPPLKGRWFTYVASMAAIESIQSSEGTKSRTSISILVALRLLPNIFITSVGGVIADSYDRRVNMLTLDVIGSLVTLLFLLAYLWRSIAGLYLANAIQMTVAAIYEPNRAALVPMLVADEESLKKAITLSALMWNIHLLLHRQPVLLHERMFLVESQRGLSSKGAQFQDIMQR